VLNLQKEYEKHKNIMLGMVHMKESYLDFDTAFQRLFGTEEHQKDMILERQKHPRLSVFRQTYPEIALREKDIKSNDHARNHMSSDLPDIEESTGSLKIGLFGSGGLPSEILKA
jgi:hypothetical protein